MPWNTDFSTEGGEMKEEGLRRQVPGLGRKRSGLERLLREVMGQHRKIPQAPPQFLWSEHWTPVTKERAR